LLEAGWYPLDIEKQREVVTVPKLSEISNSPLSIVAGGIGVTLLAAAAGVAYLRSQKSPKSKLSEALNVARSGSIPPFRFKRKSTLEATIKLLESDLSRKALIIALKAAAKRMR
jgi:acyl-coenzyme A thioesterase PaaI-like protein